MQVDEYQLRIEDEGATKVVRITFIDHKSGEQQTFDLPSAYAFQLADELAVTAVRAAPKSLSPRPDALSSGS